MSDTIASRALNEFGEMLMQKEVKERADFMEVCVVIGISLMRGGAGDDYVRRFLESALADLDKPSETFIKGRLQ